MVIDKCKEAELDKTYLSRTREITVKKEQHNTSEKKYPR